MKFFFISNSVHFLIKDIDLSTFSEILHAVLRAHRCWCLMTLYQSVCGIKLSLMYFSVGLFDCCFFVFGFNLILQFTIEFYVYLMSLQLWRYVVVVLLWFEVYFIVIVAFNWQLLSYLEGGKKAQTEKNRYNALITSTTRNVAIEVIGRWFYLWP